MKRLALLALLSSAAFAHAQTKDPRVLSCDPQSALLNSPTIFDVGRATIVKACPSFEKGAANFLAANLDSLRKLTGEQAIQWMLHGPAVLPPKDTVVTPPRDTVVVPPKDTVKPAPVADWTFCTIAGAPCLFTGLRTVRLADATNTKSVSQVAYHSVPCAGYGFGNQFPSQGALHCDYGPALLDTMVVPMAMGPITAATIVVPKGSSGSSTKDVNPSGGGGVRVDGSGSFRTTCSLAKFAFIDPIVFPGQPGKSHLHMFFGNTAVSAFTDSVSIVRLGNSTCRGGILNRTSYWTPAMIDEHGAAVMPNEGVFYYKTGYNMPPANTQPLPVGLRMIAGDPKATGPQVAPGPLPIAEWTCLVRGGTGATIPKCAVGDTVRLTIYFPSCWNGKDLDSPDHKSHMAYPNFAKGQCPSTHPVQLPQISEHFDWAVSKGANPALWHLSSDMDLTKPGISAHADWLMGWDVETMQALVVNCLQKALDCGVGGIGGKALY